MQHPKVTTEEIYFTRIPEDWNGVDFGFLSLGVRLPAGTKVEITDVTNAGFRGIEYRISTADGWKATVTNEKLMDEWDFVRADKGTLNWYRQQIATYNCRCRPQDAGFKAEAILVYNGFLAEDAESGLSEQDLLESYRNEYQEMLEDLNG